jgi:hypothetical protein
VLLHTAKRKVLWEQGRVEKCETSSHIIILFYSTSGSSVLVFETRVSCIADSCSVEGL